MLFLMLFLSMLAIVLLAVSLGLRFYEARQKKKVSGMLAGLRSEPTRAEAQVFTQDRAPDPFSSVLDSLGLRRWIEALIKRAGVDWPVSQVVISSGVLAVIGALLGTQLRVLVFRVPSMIGLALLFGALPTIYLRRKGTNRLAAFEKQFPEALDFLSRAMRAGHAFSASLEMLAAESPAPLGPEFRKVYDEQNLGASVEAALRSLAARVPLVDVRFFVSAVLLQKEVGGNLGEILRNLARVIRERFQLKGQVKAASAHGRITAVILTILPIATMLGLFLTAPGYLQVMANDETGKYLILAALIGQISGYFFMKKIVNIKI
jgi:tight adherence protein B